MPRSADSRNGLRRQSPTHHHTTAIPWLLPPPGSLYSLSSSLGLSVFPSLSLLFLPYYLSRSRSLRLLPDCLCLCLAFHVLYNLIPLLDMPLPTFQPSPSTYVGCQVRGGSRHEISDKTTPFGIFYSDRVVFLRLYQAFVRLFVSACR